MKCVLTLLLLASASASATTVTIVGTAMTLYSSSTPDSAGLWTADLTYTAGCSLGWQFSPACDVSMVFTDPGSDIFASGPRNIRLSVLNNSGIPLLTFPIGVLGATYTGRFASSHFGWFTAMNWVYFGDQQLPVSLQRNVQPGQTLIVELGVTSAAPTHTFQFDIKANSTVIPEPSTTVCAGLGILLVAVGLVGRSSRSRA